ncbi:MAG: AAA family ATPase [Theionarchaea archaeon]|nr:AAA family ATPase [Theionarchaea archaeon]
MTISTSKSTDLIVGKDIPEIELIPGLKKTEGLIADTCEYFFKGNMRMNNPPFKGFLLEGEPGTGKTELFKQVIHKLDRRLRGHGFQVHMLFVDGATIAAPKWGEAEKNLAAVFNRIHVLKDEMKYEKLSPKLVILFDDIESLMIRRGVDLAKEWHYSINSILFHEIDKLNPTDVMICATTNRPDLVDTAIQTRLYRMGVPLVSLDELMIIVKEILEYSEMAEKDRTEAAKSIKEKLSKRDTPTIRDAKHVTIIECIEGGYWSI